MLSSRQRHWLPLSTGTAVFLAALSGCGGSSLKTSRTDAGVDVPGVGLADGGPWLDGGMGTGGVIVVVGVGGALGTGGVLGTGGAFGTGGAIGRGGGFGTSGGVTGKGGATGNGGYALTGGKTSGRLGTGGSGTGGIFGTGGGTTAAMLQPLATSFCSAAQTCCVRDAVPTTSLADCESNFLSRLTQYPLVEKGTVTVDETALAACVDAYVTAATTCTITAVEAACKAVFSGTLSEGQACGGSGTFGAYECKPVDGTASCNRPKSEHAAAGVCISIPRGKSGDECSQTCFLGERCIVDMLGTAPFPVICHEEDGLYCSMITNPTVCKPILRLGDPCPREWASCGPGNYCGYTSSTCTPASKVGESCNAACAEGLTCGTGNICVEMPFASASICKGIPSAP